MWRHNDSAIMGKWAVERAAWSSQTYLPHCNGWLYATTPKVGLQEYQRFVGISSIFCASLVKCFSSLIFRARLQFGIFEGLYAMAPKRQRVDILLFNRIPLFL